MLTRRAFLASLGIGAAAVAFRGVPSVEGKTLTVEATTHEDVSLRVGDMFTIEGRYALNPVTRKVAPHLQQFCVTAIVGETVTVIPLSEPIFRHQPMPKRKKR